MNRRYNVDYLRKACEKALISRGMPDKDASMFVDSMLSADMCGVATHGVRMLPAYIRKIDRGDFSFFDPVIIRQNTSYTILDAQNTIGAVSAVKAAKIAVEQAKTSGIHIVFTRNANTFGAGAFYVEKIANEEQIGLACCNAPAAMPVFNGLEPLLGTNPLAFAVPTKSYGHIVFDMATSVVAKSKFGVAKANGQMLEPGWALDKDGNPTIDPEKAIQGLVLPMAGFKGYGLALMIDIMAGVLSGAGWLNNVGKFYSQDGAYMNVGHMIMTINPALVYDGDFLVDMDRYVETLRTSRTIKGREIIVPGDRRKTQRDRAKEYGVELSTDVVNQLEQLFNMTLEVNSKWEGKCEREKN